MLGVRWLTLLPLKPPSAPPAHPVLTFVTPLLPPTATACSCLHAWRTQRAVQLLDASLCEVCGAAYSVPQAAWRAYAASTGAGGALRLRLQALWQRAAAPLGRAMAASLLLAGIVVRARYVWLRLGQVSTARRARGGSTAWLCNWPSTRPSGTAGVMITTAPTCSVEQVTCVLCLLPSRCMAFILGKPASVASHTLLRWPTCPQHVTCCCLFMPVFRRPCSLAWHQRRCRCHTVQHCQAAEHAWCPLRCCPCAGLRRCCWWSAARWEVG